MLIAFPLQTLLQERGSLLRLYVHCVSCLSFLWFMSNLPINKNVSQL